MIHAEGVMKVVTTTCRIVVSGVRCQVSATAVDPLDGGFVNWTFIYRW
ncbi:hypothetical protein D1AOALGA4SA_4010 [Olavius algarvensis Delta 1 endosymbiont]|nr:hypothetical protein D1AOALGA4SA_4010 [Olavius algarvensis Delta 1 endosymbiont]